MTGLLERMTGPSQGLYLHQKTQICPNWASNRRFHGQSVTRQPISYSAQPT